MVMMVRGSDMSRRLQDEAKASYPHRYTRDHVPEWAKGLRPCGRPYPVHFDSDSDWLANTLFPVTKKGRIANRPQHCQSNPTWPDGCA